MKRTYLFILATLVAVVVNAAAPTGSGTYYSAADGKKGEALKTALCGILWETRYNPALSYNELWTAFHTTDVRSDGKIWDMYSDNTNYEPGGSAQGHNYSGEGDSYNREHSFPASWFGSNTPMYTDLHHIYPTDGYINNRRSNYPFGETNGNTYKSHNSFSKLGTCTVSGYTGTVFEPNEEYKGDFARTYFYMVTCYEEKLADWYSKNSESRATINGTSYPGFQTWQLNMLLKWAKDDPVSQKEIDRNTAVKNIQGNRNPFIDYPGLEQYIWGSCKDTEFSYNNYVQPTTWSTEYNSSGGGSGSGSGSGTGEGDVADVLNVTGWAGYTTGTYSDAGTDKIGTSSTTGVSYAMQVYNGSTGAVRGNQSETGNFSCRNTTTYSGYYIKEVKLTVSGGGTIDGSTSGRSVVYFGTSAFTTSPTGTATASNENASGEKTLTWTNTDTSKNYFILYNLKTSGTTASSVVTVTWGSLTPVSATDPSFNNLTDVNVDYGSSLTLTKGIDGTPNIVTDGSVTLESSNTDVVTVDGLTITPHAVGTALITVNTEASDIYKAGTVIFPITVNAPEGTSEAYVPQTTATLDFTTNSWGLPEGSSNKVVDETSYSNGTYTIKLAGSTGEGFYYNSNDKYLLLGKNQAYLTFPAFDKDVTKIDVVGRAGASSKVTQNIYVNNTAVSSATTGATGTYSYTINKLYRAAGTIYRLKVTNSNNTQITSITVHFASNNLTATLNEDGYATYCSEYPLDFSDYETAGYSAWQITGISGTSIVFEQVTGKVKGGTGLLLKGEANATVTLNSSDSSNELNDNLLYGTLAPTYVETDSYYGLSGNTFVKVNAGIVSAGKALLPASEVEGSNVKVFTFIFEEDPDGIGEIKNEELRIKNEESDSAIFNLAGQQVNTSQLKRGIYIVNGRKLLK